MDETAAIKRLSELEERVKELTQERNNFASTVVNYEAFLRVIPRSLPEGLDKSMTPYEWVQWAKKELGYNESD